MKKGQASLLSIISDGKLHSGQSLANQLNISRAAIWKSIKQLQSIGLPIEAMQGKGYQLNQTLELLSVEKIKKKLSSRTKNSYQQIEVLFKTDSTNSYLFKRLVNEKIHGHVVMAEYQTSGRGRRGNQWIAPLGSGLILSVGWRFEIVPKSLSLLSLFIGVAIARTLKAEQINEVGLKWPNDVFVNNKKIGGILLEVRGEASGPVDVVIGIGLNYALPEKFKLKIQQPATDISSHTEIHISRNDLIASILTNVHEILDEIEKEKNIELLDEWRTLDCYVGHNARLILPDEEIEGVLKGVDNQGALLMSVAGKVTSYNSGEVSLRAII